MMRTNKIEFLKSSEFIEEKIIYGFFSRNGGFSKVPYNSLNCSYNSGDDKQSVDKNIIAVQQELNIQNQKIKFIKQTHSSDVRVINHDNLFNKIIADGSITQEKKICLAILTADCAPIFLYDQNNHLICAIHSGWKGCLSNIISVAIMKIVEISKNINNIIAIVGPCLGQNSFEINESLKKKFLEKNTKYGKFLFKKDNYSKKTYFNMRGLLDYQLQEMDVKKIYHVDNDTYLQESLFFSHRKSTHADSLPTGRMINIIGFK